MIDDAARAELRQRGVVVLRQLLSPERVASLRRRIDALRLAGARTTRQILYTHQVPTDPRPPFSELMEQWFDPHRRADACSTQEAVDALALHLSKAFPGLRLLQDVLLVKQPQHREFAWHQDEPFWPWEAADGVVVWCALDAVDRENGAVEFAAGSHSLGRGVAIDLHTGEDQAGGRAPNLSAYEVVCPRLGAGDAVLFGARTWHRSGRNRTTSPRRAWSSSWLPPEAVWRPDLAPLHPLVRGSCDSAASRPRSAP